MSDVEGLVKALDIPVLSITARCPVELVVETPSGLIQSKSHSGIFGAKYNEVDIDGDGETDRFIEIPLPEQGDYSITVTPEADADPNDTYSLEMEQAGAVTVIQQDESITNLDGTPAARML